MIDKGGYHDPKMSFFLPFPPSVNSMYRNVRGVGRVKSAKYKEWEAMAWFAFKQAYPHQDYSGDALLHESDYVLVLQLIKPRNKNGKFTKRKLDLDNHIKAISDLLVAANCVTDDSYLRRIIAEYVYPDNDFLPELYGSRGTAQVSLYRYV